jgi:hypothetical protein
VKHYEGMFILHNRELPEGETADPEEVVRLLITRAGGGGRGLGGEGWRQEGGGGEKAESRVSGVPTDHGDGSPEGADGHGWDGQGESMKHRVKREWYI